MVRHAGVVDEIVEALSASFLEPRFKNASKLSTSPVSSGKPSLLEAVIAQIDDEMTECLDAIVDRAESHWQGFLAEIEAYVEMSLEPEIRRIVLLDGPAVLGDPSKWPSQLACVRATRRSLELMMEEGTIRAVDIDTMAHLISAAALSGTHRVASAEDPKEASRQVVRSLNLLLSGLPTRPGQTEGGPSRS